MTAENMEPVEISTRFRPGEWTEESLAALTASYEEKIRAMGAESEEIATHIDRGANGSVALSVSWDPGARQAAADMDLPTAGASVAGSPEVARGFGEDIPPGEITQDAKGLGAVLGDADRSAIDDPPRNPRSIHSSGNDEILKTLTRRTDEEGKPYLEDVEDTGPRTTD